MGPDLLDDIDEDELMKTQKAKKEEDKKKAQGRKKRKRKVNQADL